MPFPRLQELVRKRPDSYSAYYNLGLAYEDNNQTDQAISALTKALAIRNSQNIQETTIYNSLGWAYLTYGQYEQAEKYLLMAANAETKNSS